LRVSPRFLRQPHLLGYADAINVASLSDLDVVDGDVDATLTGLVDAAYEVLAGRGQRLDRNVRGRAQPGDASTVDRWIRARLIAAWSHDILGTPENPVENLQDPDEDLDVAQLDYRNLVGRDASLRSWGSRQSLEDVRVLLRAVDPTDIAVLIWAGTEIAGAVVQVDAWLQDNPTHPGHPDVTEDHEDLTRLSDWFTEPGDSDIDDVIGDLRETRRYLSRSMGQYVGPVPAWRADPNDPDTIALAEAMTTIDGVLVQVDAWLPENPTHPLHTEVTVDRDDLSIRRGWLDVVYDRNDFDDVILIAERFRRDLSQSTGQYLGPVPEWRADPNDPATIAATRATAEVDAAIAQVDAWLRDNPTHPLHTGVTQGRDDLIIRRGWLAAAEGHGQVAADIGSVQETRRTLSRLLGQYVGPAPEWRADPNDPATIAATEATAEVDAAIAQVDAWLRDNPTHPQRTGVTQGRDDLISRRGWLAVPWYQGGVDNDIRSSTETRRTLSRLLGQYVGPAPEWSAEPDHPNTIAVTQATSVIDGVLAQVNDWLEDNPTHRHLQAVTRGRANLIADRAELGRVHTRQDILFVTENLPEQFRLLGLSMGRRVAPLPEWRADPNHLDTIAVTQATTVIDGVVVQVDAWLQENPTHHRRSWVNTLRKDLDDYRIEFEVANDHNHVDQIITSGRLPGALISISAALGPLGEEPLGWYDAVQGPLNGLTPQEWWTALGAATTRVLALPPDVIVEARTRAGDTVTAVITARNIAADSEGRALPAVLAARIQAAVIDTVAWTLIDDPNTPPAREITPQDLDFVDLLLDGSDVALRQAQSQPSGAPSTADVEDDGEDSGDDSGDSGGDDDGDDSGDDDGDDSGHSAVEDDGGDSAVEDDGADSDGEDDGGDSDGEDDGGDSDVDDSGDSDEDSDGDEPDAPRAVGAVSGQVGDAPLGWYNAVQAPLNGLTPQQWWAALRAGITRVLALPPEVREEARTRAGVTVDAVIRARNAAAVS
ncbi:MAG: hypothetical protein ACRYF3_03465, partial [Janthinobacterium lividum]